MKQKLNFIIDALMFLLMAAISGLGFLIKYVLVPGQVRTEKFGRFVDLYFLGLDRHQWGSIHLILSFILIALLLLHIVLHWALVKCLFRKLITQTSFRWILSVIFCLVCLFCFIFPFFVPIDIRDVAAGEGHQHHSQYAAEVVEPEHEQRATNRQQKVDVAEQQIHHRDANIEINGSMSLGQVSSQYNIPVQVLLSGLKINQFYASDTRIGHLRKRYGFDMNDVAEVITKYKSGSTK